MPRGVDRWDEARLQGRLWTPQAEPSLQLRVWLDAADLSTLTINASNVVTQWLDKSGNGQNGAPAATYFSSGGPLFRATGGASTLYPFRRTPCVFFNGANDISGSVSITGNTLMLYAMATVGSGGGRYGRIASLNVTGTVDYNNISYMALPKSAATATSYGLERNSASYGNVPYTYDNPGVFGGVFSGSSGWVTVNAVKGTAVSVSSNFAIQNFRIGGSNWSDSQSLLSGYVNEWILGVGTYTERIGSLMEGYLAWKWLGSMNTLPASHPFKNRPPLIGD